MFFDRVSQLCNEQNISLTALMAELKMSVGNVTKWKDGKPPKADTVLKVARYFKVTADYLLELSDEKKSAADNGNGLSAEEELFMSIYRSLPPEKRMELMDFGRYKAEK